MNSLRVNEKNLIGTGYKIFTNALKIKSYNSYIKSYQKRFDDADGKRYFITIDEYDNKNLPVYNNPYGYSASAQFYIDTGETLEQTFDVEFFVYETTRIQDIEDFYEKIFVRMQCRHYETNYEY